MSNPITHSYAVVVGVGDDLPVTVNDANALSNLLCDQDRCAFSPQNVRTLIECDASRNNILSTMDWLALQTQANPEATAIVFYSGHGIESTDYHLLTYGYDLAKLTHTAISGEEFTEKLRSIDSQRLLVLLDCCHAGGMADAEKGIVAKSPIPKSMLGTLHIGSGRVVIASSRKDEVSLTGRPYSIFTTALLEALAGYGAFESDGYARVLDTAMWIGRKVPERSRDRQHPIIKVSELENNFALAYYAGGSKRPRKLEWRVRAPHVSVEFEDSQVKSWQRMLSNYRENLLLIEERMSEYVEFAAIPLQLVKSKRRIEKQIQEIEGKLGFSS
jgi:hypothetical protein